MKYDLHTHTKYSADGVMEPAVLVKIAKKRGLEGIAVTDHNTLRGALFTKQYQTPDFQVIAGMEITTERGEIIGLFLSEEITARYFTDVVTQIHDQNGIVIVPHPFDRLRHSAFFPRENDAHYFDAVEGFNARCIIQKDNEKSQMYANKLKLCLTAGSDAHYSNEIGNAGIIIPDEEIRESILRNHTKIFGRRTHMINPLYTKGLKFWRKILPYNND